MRALIASVLLVAAPGTAAAQDVLWLGDVGDELATALELELAARSLSLGRGPSPRGGTAEAARRRAALECELRGARVALFAAEGAVHAVSDAGAPREAALPSDEPRLVAIVAASLVDESLDASTPPTARLASPYLPAPGEEAERAPVVETETDALGLAAYALLRVSFVALHQGSIGLPHHTLEAGVSLDRTWRVGLQVVGPITSPHRVDAEGGSAAPENGTPGVGGGIAVSMRGAVDQLELRGGAELAMGGRGAQNPRHREFPITEPSSMPQAGVVAGIRLALGFRPTRSTALLLGVTFGVIAWSTSDALGYLGTHVAMELF